MAYGDAINFETRKSSTARRTFLKGTLSLGLSAAFARAAAADKLSCMPVQRMAEEKRHSPPPTRRSASASPI